MLTPTCEASCCKNINLVWGQFRRPLHVLIFTQLYVTKKQFCLGMLLFANKRQQKSRHLHVTICCRDTDRQKNTHLRPVLPVGYDCNNDDTDATPATTNSQRVRTPLLPLQLQRLPVRAESRPHTTALTTSRSRSSSSHNQMSTCTQALFLAIRFKYNHNLIPRAGWTDRACDRGGRALLLRPIRPVSHRKKRHMPLW